MCTRDPVFTSIACYCIHEQIDTLLTTHEGTNARTHDRTNTRTHESTNARTHERTYTLTHVRTCARTHALTDVHKRAHSNKHTHAHCAHYQCLNSMKTPIYICQLFLFLNDRLSIATVSTPTINTSRRCFFLTKTTTICYQHSNIVAPFQTKLEFRRVPSHPTHGYSYACSIKPSTKSPTNA